MKHLLLAVLLMLALGATASANIELELISGGFATVPIIGTPCSTDTCVTYSGTVGGWTINLTSGDSSGPTNPTMTLTSFDATGAPGAAPLELLLSDSFSVASSAWTLQGTGTLISGAGTAAFSAYLDNTNTYLTTSPADLIGTLGPFSGGYNQSGSYSTSGVPLYTLTEAVQLTAASGSTV